MASVLSTPPDANCKFLFKVVLAGNAGVGKTCLIRRFTDGVAPVLPSEPSAAPSSTLGVDLRMKIVNVGNDESVKLQIWDTAGQERFRAISRAYYRTAHAVLIVFDVCCAASFNCLPQWLRDVEQHTNPNVMKVLVGNKIDQDDFRETLTDVGQRFAEENGFDAYFETSAVSATNVDALFEQIALRLCNEFKRKETNGDRRKSSVCVWSAWPSGSCSSCYGTGGNEAKESNHLPQTAAVANGSVPQTQQPQLHNSMEKY